MSSTTRRLAALVLIAAAVAFVAILATRTSGPLESSWAYTNGLELARAHSDVRDALGEPIEAGAVDGFVRVSGETGDAELEVPLSGPRGRGVLRVTARKRYENWAFERAEVELGGGRRRVGLIE